jgi:hypothetical protein
VEYLGVEGILLKWIVKIQGVPTWTGFLWLWIGSSDGLFRIKVTKNFGLHKGWEICFYT